MWRVKEQIRTYLDSYDFVYLFIRGVLAQKPNPAYAEPLSVRFTLYPWHPRTGSGTQQVLKDILMIDETDKVPSSH